VTLAPSPVVVIGAGPAGLTAAYELSKLGRPSLLLEADGQVGGLARTVRYDDYRFDIGGHRLGPRESLLVGLSYLRARLVPSGEEANFEQWVSRRFGRRLYRVFFKTYTGADGWRPGTAAPPRGRGSRWPGTTSSRPCPCAS
jgi:protoporphyrinogen oxidase